MRVILENLNRDSCGNVRGIDPSCVTFEDNSAFIFVVDNEKSKEGPIGIMAQLNSSCKNGSGYFVCG